MVSAFLFSRCDGSPDFSRRHVSFEQDVLSQALFGKFMKQISDKGNVNKMHMRIQKINQLPQSPANLP